MEKISNLVVDIDKESQLKEIAAKMLGWKSSEIQYFNIVRRSIDARKKHNIKLIFSVEASKTKYNSPDYIINDVKSKPEYPPIVVGFGPCGIFCAHTLAMAGLNPIVLERGESVGNRKQKIDTFWQKGVLDKESNVQFGEGGAGAFSDGKLNTGIGDKDRQTYILNTLIKYGAPEEIAYDCKPHIGTDNLAKIVKAMRQEIIARGGVVSFGAKVTDIIITDNIIKVIADKEYYTEHLIIAIGHSARDTYRMLHQKGFAMQSKPFSVGLRIEHKRKDIDKSMYGNFCGHPALGAADYRLVEHTKHGGVYSFCMCPGGYVIASSSEDNTIVTNGMSYYNRDAENSNSAILKGVDEKDYGEGLFKGMEYQINLEKKAYDEGGGNYYAPVQLLGDFIKGRQSAAFGEVVPSYTPGVRFSRLDYLLGENTAAAISEALIAFGKKIRAFSLNDAVLTGVETRSSSPIKILRNDNFESISYPQVYPAGEGCGYAGGIMSAAVDGMRVAESIIKRFV